MAFDLHADLRNALVPLGRHQRLLEVLEAARRLAEELGDERRLAQVLSFLSNYYGNVGNSDLALETGERALVLGERVGAIDLALGGNMSVGEIYRTLGNYPRAREFLRRAVALIGPDHEQDAFGQVGLPAVRARSHLAWTLAELGEFEQARASAAAGLQLADASHHAYSICHACLGLGGVRVRIGEFESAISILMRGFATSEQVPLLRPPIAADLGVALARCGRIAEGLSYVDAAVEGATQMGRMSRLPLLLVKCGEIHLLAGEPAAATRLATTAHSLATEQKERGNEVYASHLLGEILATADSASEPARRHFADALALAEELGMRPLAAHCHAGLGRFFTRAGESEKAHQHLTAASTMYRAMAMRFWLVQLERDAAALAPARSLP
jgi:tetratricopeptide (TPR) repeat protein